MTSFNNDSKIKLFLKGYKCMLSVIVPVYNVEEYVGESLESLLKALKNIDSEIIVIDDGSTDGSAEVIKNIAAKDKSIKYVHQENQGVSVARNKGIKMAKGKYIGFIDSDDIVSEDMYEKLITTCERDGTNISSCKMVRFNSTEVKPYILTKRAFNNSTDFCEEISQSEGLMYDYPVVNKVFRTDFLKENNIYFPENRRFEDMYFAMKALLCSGKISVVRTVGYLYRIREGENKSYTQTTQNIENLLQRTGMLTSIYELYAKEFGSEAPEIIRLKKRFLVHDLQFFINKVPLMDDEYAADYIKAIKEFITSDIFDDDISRINSPIISQKYKAIINDDVSKLRELLEFEKNHYSALPVSEKDGRLKALLPEELFDMSEGPIDDDYNQAPPRCYIKRGQVKYNRIYIYAHVYYPRVSIPQPRDGQIRAYLQNDITKKRQELSLKYFENSRLTKIKGEVEDTYNHETHHYNYDGTAFYIRIDPGKIKNPADFIGDNIIVIEYDLKYFSGSFELYSQKGKAADEIALLSLKKDSFTYGIDFDGSGTFNLIVTDEKQN